MIEIPDHPKRRENQRRGCPGDMIPCIVCSKPIKNPANYIHIWWGSHAVTEEEASILRERQKIKCTGDGDLGAQAIGSCCLKNNPELKPYVSKGK